MDFCWQSNASAFQYIKFVIAFLLRSKRLLISCLQSLSAVILEPKLWMSLEVKVKLDAVKNNIALEKEMATHSSSLAWRILWTEEPVGLQSMRSQSHA